MSSPDRFRRILVTSALPYANGPLHIGHIAGAYLPADIYCRYQRLQGRDVVFICGSDEHGVPILLRARGENVSPQVIVDRYHDQIKRAFERLGMSFDYYGRTSSKVHRTTSQDFFRVLLQKGLLVKKSEQQLYDPEQKMFLADRFVRGTCPHCDYPDAYGDQCEKCGRAMSPAELKEPRSALSDAVPEWRETAHWFFPMARMQAEMEQWIASREGWKANVIGQANSWLKEGLADRAMTRDLPWGVPVPRDLAEAEGVDPEGKVLYVWFDAPIGYISATREWAARQGDPARWKTYWCSEETRLVHFIGKDNIVFHTLIFPAMLRSYGGYVLPDNVPANEFLNVEGQKLSTSRGWAVWVAEFLDDFPADYLRYSLLGILPETKDSDFSFKDMQARVNNELADTFGNFVNRTVAFTRRFFDGKVPELSAPGEMEEQLFRELERYPERIGECIETFRFREAGGQLMALARTANKYFNDAQPWATRESDPKKCANTLHAALQVCASLSILCEPFLPFSAEKIRKTLALEGVRSSLPGAPGGTLSWEAAGRPLLVAGQALAESDILFTKLEDEAVAAQVARLHSATEDKGGPEELGYQPVGETMVYDDFAKLDLRVASVLVAEKVPKSKKLLRCEVDLGFERRQVLAGVAEQMQPEDLVGKKVVMVANLAPRKMMGLESHGMLLMATDREGKMVPLLAEGSEPGARVS